VTRQSDLTSPGLTRDRSMNASRSAIGASIVPSAVFCSCTSDSRYPRSVPS
jgi:hypothetical protein